MRKTPEDFFDLKKNGLLMQAGKIIFLEPKLPRNSSVLTFSPSSFAGICC